MDFSLQQAGNTSSGYLKPATRISASPKHSGSLKHGRLRPPV
ncbi:hypothetical protein HMPREF9371_2377 [Neisseria shayeganii 871]|uniref:Uncharacterized protein n=1 Tax=Neisseria shayeganii 871 TaxID=1032488 RepID=G4CL86_9NEIS|nr:hypothetical protein HMPREF9371_2377 [Neisseria shayeganii 871]